MRVLLCVLTGLVIVTGAFAFQPQSNITRGMYCHPLDALSTSVWTQSGKLGEFVTDEKRSGEWSLKCDNSGGVKGTCRGVAQTVHFNQTEPRPIKIAGWSKALDVAPGSPYEYSIYLDLRYADDTPWFMQIAAFKPGTHDWEYSESIVTPEKPVRYASVHVFLREKSGIAWFDDLFIGEAEGENLLRCPGFEDRDRADRTARDKLFAEYHDLNANAMHIYLSPGSPVWSSELLGREYEGKSPLEGFTEALAGEGIGLWVTTGEISHAITDVNDPDFPEYYCPNERWGQDWVAVLGDVARYDLAGLSLVPDEYNYHNSHVRRSMEKHPDEGVREFYAKMPPYCDGPGCRDWYKRAFGVDMPDLHTVQQTDAWRDYINFRYMTTTEWIRKGAEAIKQANPNCRADSLICVSPVCSDIWWPVGVAWDQIGTQTKIDFLTTDPYILLHNYLGDSTHWYVTETCERLSGAHPKRQCGSVLEASRLRPEYRELAPVEVYGSALSSVFHGARELAWWHHGHITGVYPTAENQEQTYGIVKSTYQLIEEVDPWLDDLTPVKTVALLHSRASEDWWRFYSTGDPHPCLTHADKGERYASRAQVEVLIHCLRNNVPVDLYYLESVRAEQLADYPVIVVPFAFAISDGQAAMLQALAEQGKQIVIISEVGTITEDGKVRERAALLDLIGLQSAPSGEQEGTLEPAPGIDTGDWVRANDVVTYETVEVGEGSEVDATVNGVPAGISRRVGQGGVLFLAGEFGVGLPESYDNETRGRLKRVYPPIYNQTQGRVLLEIYRAFAGGRPQVAQIGEIAYEGEAPPFPDDVEVVMATNALGDVICFCANWTEGTAPIALRIDEATHDGARAEGRALLPDASVRAVSGLPTELAPQEAMVLRVPRRG